MPAHENFAGSSFFMALEDLFKENGQRIDDILGMNIDLTDARVVPKTEDVGFEEGRQIETAVLFIDMRGSTVLSQDTQRKTISKIYKSFFDSVSKVVSYKTDAHIRGFAGDRLMAVFSPGEDSCNNAVDTAIIMQTVITHILNPKLKEKFNVKIDYGIGIDYGKMMVVRVGIYGGGSNSDLVWSGRTANYASKLADHDGALGSGIRITNTVFNKLTAHLTSPQGSTLWSKEYTTTIGGETISYHKDESIYKTAIDNI